VVGTVLAAGGGTAVALASTGAHVPLVAQSHAQQQQADDDASDDHGGAQKNDDQADSDNEANENELNGTVSSINAANSTFVLQVAGGGTKTVTVSPQTVFDGGPQRFSDLRAGMSVEVKGNLQSNGTLAALRIHGEDDAVGGRGSGGSGRGGPDDG